jgi:hypothetical protein
MLHFDRRTGVNRREIVLARIIHGRDRYLVIVLLVGAAGMSLALPKPSIPTVEPIRLPADPGKRTSSENLSSIQVEEQSVTQQNIRLFKADGQHQCQSKTDLGHKCSVFGTEYTDCTQAAAKLKSQDCCPATRRCNKDAKTGKETCSLGGTSIGFELLHCSAFK